MRSCLVCLLLAPAALAADWTRFRGPNGTGVSADKTVPVKWAAENVLFRAEVPGNGHSSPVVSAGRVFLLSATRDERLVLCYDAATGKQRWRKAVPGKVVKTHLKSSLASSTPCVEGGRLFCSFWDGNKVSLHAYSLDGEALWTKDLGPFSSQHGPGFSPMAVNGRVYVNLDQDGSAKLLCFDAKTGVERNRVERTAFRSCYSTPFVRGDGADAELVVASTEGVTGYSLAKGLKAVWEHRWEFPVKPLRTVGSPVEGGGVIVACSGDGDGSRAMIAVRPGSADAKAALAWSKESGTPYVPTLVAHEGHFYGVLDNGNAVCYHAQSGETRWNERLGGPTSASPVLIDGKVLAVDEKGVAHVFATDPKVLRVLATNSVGEAVFATPAVADGRLYVRGAKSLICVGKAKE